jgi:signal transduction histidine kinase
MIGPALAHGAPPAAFAGSPWAGAAASVFEHAPYLRRLIERRGDLVADVDADWPRRLLADALAQANAIATAPPALDEGMRTLRRAKDAVHLAVAIADLARAWPLAQVTQAITDFADAALRGALALAATERAEHGDIVAAETPLSTITVAGKTLEMEKIRQNDAKILETAKLIGKQSIHLNQLINMILEISMWERTQFQLEKKKVKIEEVMDDIIESFESGCSTCAELQKKYNFSGVEVDIDQVYFTTLINNLLSNAVKYSENKPVINVEGFAENNNIHIKVIDNGIGISKLDQKHVFDKFYRASSGNIHKYKGLGLGLYYVKKIAEAHGGDVTVSSKPGKGSIFTVTIPY